MRIYDDSQQQQEVNSLAAVTFILDPAERDRFILRGGGMIYGWIR